MAPNIRDLPMLAEGLVQVKVVVAAVPVKRGLDMRMSAEASSQV